MKLFTEWYEFLRREHSFTHKCLTTLYFVRPLILVALSRADGMPLASLERTSSLSSILLGEIILLITHMGTAGTMQSFNQGESERATTIASYSGIALVCLILLVP